MVQAGLKKASPSKINSKAGISSLIIFVVLLLAWIAGFSSRLFAVIRFESIIHEFDPWFNYRATAYMVKHGFYNFLNWFDERAWYPLGRIVGGTVYPGLMLTSGSIHYLLHLLHINVHIRDICVFLAPIFSGLTSISTYFLTKELWSPGAGLFAACFIAIVPGYISRSVAGSYDNEGIAIFALQFTYFLWIKSVKTGSVFWAVAASLSYFYMVSAWGGYVFIINLIPLHVFVLLLMGRFSNRLFTSYTTFYILGLIFSMQIPFVGFQPIRTSEHMAAGGVFALLFAVALLRYLQSMMSKSEFKTLAVFGGIASAGVVFLSVVLLTYAGYVAPWSGRFYSLWDTGYAKIHIPIIASVSEHQPTTWFSFFFDLHILIATFPAGLWYTIKNINDERVFVVLYALSAVYFAGVMVRLMLTLTPVVCMLSGIAFSGLLECFLREDDSTRAEESEEEEQSTPNKRMYDKAGRVPKMKHEQRSAAGGADPTDDGGGIGPNLRSIVTVVVLLLLMLFAVHCTWVTSNAYSSPSIVLASYGNDGTRQILDDFREAYFWLSQNTVDEARVMSWWDYGYQIAGMANRTTLVDNNTWNNSHIALVGKAMSSNETAAYDIMTALDVDYVLVIFGGVIGYSGDDINKFLWMVRIAEGEHPKDIRESDYFTEQGEFRIDAEGSPTLLNCLMYKLSYYRFGELKLDFRSPAGFDRTRNAVIGNKDIQLTYLEEAYTTEHWLVRVYRVKKPDEFNRPRIPVANRVVKSSNYVSKKNMRALMQKAADRQRELEDALNDAQRFNAEIQDLLAWLGDVDSILTASKPVGGLPETATEQLERFMEIYNEIEENKPKVETVLAQGQEYLKKAATPASNLQHNLRTLKQRWDHVTSRANDKKIKLEIALKEATEFHESLQAFVDWLTNAEKILSNLQPVSRVLDTIQEQIEEHKVFQKDVSAHREIMLALDKKGTHLKYFSQKQDVILIKNLLISVQHRWERVASKSAERTRALDLGYKEAKEFHDSWAGLMNWLDDTEQSLDEFLAETIGNDPDKIKSRLAKHQEFQKALSGKQASYDAVTKAGKLLKDKAPKTDEPTIKHMLAELKAKWNSVCHKSVERQRKLEEALLYSGQFKDAMAALVQWLRRAEEELAADSPVHGDLDTVNHLVDLHRRFEKELEKRNDQMESVMRSGQELERSANKADAIQIRAELGELTELWETVTGLATAKSERLRDALKDAERLHRSVNMILDWLSEAERKLRFAGNAPEDEAAAYEQLRTLDAFRAQLSEKELEKDQTLELAHGVLAKAHMDAVNVIKNWIKIIQSRWEEVSQWALQRHQKLSQHVQSLRDMDESLEELVQWLLGLESTLMALKREELPMDIPATEQLIADHKEFMENTQKRQGEVDRVCKAKQVKAAQAVKDSKKLVKGKGQIRVSPGREYSPDPQLPHIGPRFPPSGSEPEFRSPRVKFLYDKWRHVWMLSWERQRELHDHLAYLKEKEKADNFSWDDWRKRFLKFMNYKKSRLTDLFRKMDKDNNELIPRDDFIEGIIRTKFDTSRMEMKHVADMFDEQNRGLIDWKKFIAALRPDWEEKTPDNDAQKIHDEVKRLVMLCTCRQKFRVFQVGEGKYRFGESQKLRLVRILRSTVMVRVGGGWVALDEFLVKNDPCRAKGRTNIELREQFILADGVSQTMTAFKPRTSASSPASGSSASSLRTATPGPIYKVRERTQRSVPMSAGHSRASKSSLSAGTPDSLSDNEGGSGQPPRTPRRPAPRAALTPGGSRTNSRPASRAGSRPGSKPPSRHGSNLSLDSTDDATPSRIPRRTPISGRTATTMSTTKKPINGSGSRPRTPSGLISPASPATRSASTSKVKQVTIGIAPTLRTASRTRTPSGSNTPVHPDQQTAVSRLLRRPSGASETATGQTRKKQSSIADREPFRL